MHQVVGGQVVEDHRGVVQAMAGGDLGGVDGQVAVRQAHSLGRTGGTAGEVHAYGGVQVHRKLRGAPGRERRVDRDRPRVQPERLDPLGQFRGDEQQPHAGRVQDVRQRFAAQERVHRDDRVAAARHRVEQHRELRRQRSRDADHGAGTDGAGEHRRGRVDPGVQLGEAERGVPGDDRRVLGAGQRGPAQQGIQRGPRSVRLQRSVRHRRAPRRRTWPAAGWSCCWCSAPGAGSGACRQRWYRRRAAPACPAGWSRCAGRRR